MKLIYFTFYLLLLSIQTVVGQAYRCAVYINHHWGYIDGKGNIKVTPKYDKALPFSSDGVALVSVTGTLDYKLIDTSGVVIKTEAKIISIKGKKFIEGMIPIKVNNKWGYLNSKGKLAITPKYNDASEWGDGHAIVRLKNDFFVIDASGNESLISNVKVADSWPFNDGLAAIVTPEGKKGFVNTRGQLAIGPRHSRAGNFHGELAWVKNELGQVQYINKEGRVAFEGVFDVGKDFDPVSRVALVKKDGIRYFIDSNGKKINMQVEGCGDFKNGFAYCHEGDKVGFKNSQGSWVITPQFRIVQDFQNGFAAVVKDNLWGFIDGSGSYVVKPAFDDVGEMELIMGQSN